MNLSSHLESRHMDVSRYSSIHLDEENGLVLFLLWNLSGQLVGYQQYRPSASKKGQNNPRENRYYTSIHGNRNEKPLAVWGLETLAYRKDLLVICEGVFDACRLHNQGIPAIATLTGTPRHLDLWLFSLGRKLYTVPDDHGSKLGRYEELQLPPDRGDLGECTEEEIIVLTNRLN